MITAGGFIRDGELSFHYGIDFGTPWQSEIKSIAIGEVIFAGDYGTYGNTVIIRHEMYEM
jgi:lysostaphin